MKYSEGYKQLLGCDSSAEVFDYLVSNLKDTISGWDYFVNWSKAHSSVLKIEMNLNLLNVLIGKDDVTKVALDLFREHPEVKEVIPILLACREKKFNLLKEYQNGNFIYETYQFNRAITAEKAVEFMKLSGLLEHFEKKNIKSVVDYVFGVEVGLDSNGRKNRGGAAMEEIVEFFVDTICKKYSGMEYIPQATADKIFKAWNKKITVDKSSRTIDFAVKNHKGQYFLIETNFYGKGGSKLKSTAGEYQTDFRRWKNDGCQFIWITDGAGWNSTKRPLEDTFTNIDCILNLKMIEAGMLEDLLSS